MLTTINVFITSHIYHSCVCAWAHTHAMKMLMTYSPSKFHVSHTVLLTIVTRLYIRTPEFIHLLNESLESLFKILSTSVSKPESAQLLHLPYEDFAAILPSVTFPSCELILKDFLNTYSVLGQPTVFAGCHSPETCNHLLWNTNVIT